jgi:hypothetical protein
VVVWPSLVAISICWSIMRRFFPFDGFAIFVLWPRYDCKETLT